MDDAVRVASASTEAVQVFDVAVKWDGTDRRKYGGVGIASGQPNDRVSMCEQLLDRGLTDEASGTSDEDAHDDNEVKVPAAYGFRKSGFDEFQGLQKRGSQSVEDGFRYV